jgi:SAM-dependent methyltransferase
MKNVLGKVPLLAPVLRSLRDKARLLQFRREFAEFERKATRPPRFRMEWKERWACMHDRTAGLHVESHYTYHPAWAARVLAQTCPAKHVDISSAATFATLVSAFIPFEYYEWRPVDFGLSNLHTAHANLLNLPFADNSVESLSCMHTVEHVGLGRYGDPVDSDGDLKAIKELKRVLKPGGSLLFAVPMGKAARIRLNANRTYTYEQVVESHAELKVKQFA